MSRHSYTAIIDTGLETQTAILCLLSSEPFDHENRLPNTIVKAAVIKYEIEICILTGKRNECQRKLKIIVLWLTRVCEGILLLKIMLHSSCLFSVRIVPRNRHASVFTPILLKRVVVRRFQRCVVKKDTEIKVTYLYNIVRVV
jgi:hypothetical protein